MVFSHTSLGDCYGLDKGQRKTLVLKVWPQPVTLLEDSGTSEPWSLVGGPQAIGDVPWRAPNSFSSSLLFPGHEVSGSAL
jgi:hypothetical protein